MIDIATYSIYVPQVTLLSMLKASLAALTRFCLSRRSMYRFNLHLYKMALRGLGVLNSDTESATGEPWFQSWLENRTHPSIVFDVGANDRAYGDGIFLQAKIYAFEPHPESFKRLQLHSSPNVIPIHAAVGAQNGRTTLWDFANNAPKKNEQPTSQLATLHKQVMSEMYHQPARSYQVRQMTLDAFARKNKVQHINLLKIDAEGNELAVLDGAKKLLKSGEIDIIQFEFNEMHAYIGVQIREIFALLPTYSFFRLLPKELLPIESYRPLTHEIYGFQNIVCIQRSLVERLHL